MLLKVLHSICQQIWKTQQWPQDWKRSVFIPITKKANAKECSNYHTIAFISHASKVMLKILQARLQQYMNRELTDVQVGFRKGRGTRDQIANLLIQFKRFFCHGQPRRNGQSLRKVKPPKTEPGRNIKHEHTSYKYWNWISGLKTPKKQKFRTR